jgi:hypothetical protein
MNLSPKRGRGERRMPVAPAASCALCIGRKHTSSNEYPGIRGERMVDLTIAARNLVFSEGSLTEPCPQHRPARVQGRLQKAYIETSAGEPPPN